MLRAPPVADYGHMWPQMAQMTGNGPPETRQSKTRARAVERPGMCTLAGTSMPSASLPDGQTRSDEPPYRSRARPSERIVFRTVSWTNATSFSMYDYTLQGRRELCVHDGALRGG